LPTVHETHSFFGEAAIVGSHFGLGPIDRITGILFGVILRGKGQPASSGASVHFTELARRRTIHRRRAPHCVNLNGRGAMPFILRFVQSFRPDDREAFMKLEADFAAMEQRRSDFPQGRRRQPYAGRLPTNTLICEFEYATLAEVQQALATLAGDAEHERLFRLQAPYMLDAWTEIDEVLEFPAGGAPK
jgi:hypothetical protein